jgi:hypothetical protein
LPGLIDRIIASPAASVSFITVPGTAVTEGGMMQFAKRVYLLAGITGVILVIPAYFLEGLNATINPPAIEHPEFYYGFVGVVLVWQLVYILIGSDPVRHRPVMPLAALAKGTFVVTLLVLFVVGRLRSLWLGFAAFDGTFAVLFLVAYVRTAGEGAPSDGGTGGAT